MPSVELHFGRDVAPGGFAWAVPVVRPDGFYVRIGVMAARDAPGCYRRMLERVGDRWGVSHRELPPRQKILPLGAIERTYADRLLAIGDAAGLVKPTTGRRHPLQHRERLARRRRGASRRSRPIGSTRRRWRRTSARGAPSSRTNSTRSRSCATWPPGLSDQAIDSFFELAHTDGIMPIVRATARFNEHRPLIRALFKHPPARRILFKSIVG